MANHKSRRAPSAQSKDSDKMNASKAAVSIETLMEELDQSGRKFKKSTTGHRALLRDSLQTAQRIIVKFLESETLQKQFVRAVKKGEKNGRKKARPVNMPLEVVAKA